MSATHQGIKTRDEILQTAARLFAQQGYHNTSTSEILQSAAISKGAFYYHFSSKGQLAREVLEQLRRDYEEQLVKPVWADGKSGQRFRHAGHIIVALNQSGQWTHCAMLARLAAEMAFTHDPLTEMIGHTVVWIVGFWKEVIADDQAHGSMTSKTDAAKLAELVVSAIFGATTNSELLGRRDHLGQVFDQFVDMTAACENIAGS